MQEPNRQERQKANPQKLDNPCGTIFAGETPARATETVALPKIRQGFRRLHGSADEKRKTLEDLRSKVDSTLSTAE